MASQTWTKTTSGTVFDTQGNNVGSGDGAGTITLTSAAIEVGPATEFLRITEGVTVKFPAGAWVNVRCTAGSGTFGTFDVNGTEAEPVVLTSVAGSPAPGDWNGIRWIGANPAIPGVAPVVDLLHCTVQFYVNIITQSGAGFVPQGFTAHECVFRKFSVAAISHQGGAGGTFPWSVTYCCFISCVGDGAVNIVQCLAGGLPTGDQRPLLTLDHCSFLYDQNSVSNVFVLNCGARSQMTFKSSIAVVTNPGAGQGNILALGSPGPVFITNNNFYLSADAGILEEYPPSATDQNVDPEYLDDTCSNPDLSPNAQVGDPLLYLASEDGIYCGAKIPYNIPSTSGEVPGGVESTTEQSTSPPLPTEV